INDTDNSKVEPKQSKNSLSKGNIINSIDNSNIESQEPKQLSPNGIVSDNKKDLIFENDFYNMFKKVCHNEDIAFYCDLEYNNHNYLLCFKKFFKPVEIVKINKDENSIINYLKNQEAEKAENYEDKKYFYFAGIKRDGSNFIAKEYNEGKDLSNNYLFITPTKFLSAYSNRNILTGVVSDDQRVSHLFFSIVLKTLIKMKEHLVNNDFFERSILSNIRDHLLGNNMKLKNGRAMQKAKKFFLYLLKEKRLPEIKNVEKHKKLLEYVLQDEKMSFYNGMAVCWDSFIYDLPFGLIEHIISSFCVVAFN
ncbi:hypothetical protein NGRA_3482, partial [Nosema granulosis]